MGIKTQEDHRTAMAELERLLDIDPAIGTKDANKLIRLASDIQEYEQEHFKFDAPKQAELLIFRIYEKYGL